MSYRMLVQTRGWQGGAWPIERVEVREEVLDAQEADMQGRLQAGRRDNSPSDLGCMMCAAAEHTSVDPQRSCFG